MNRAQQLLHKMNESSSKKEDPISESINRIPVRKTADLSKVMKMAIALPKSFDSTWEKLKIAKDEMSDLLWSMNNSYREVRLFSEDNFTLDPTINLDKLSPALQKDISDLDSMVRKLDDAYGGLGQAIAGASDAMGTGALKRQFKGFAKDNQTAIDLMKKVQAGLKKSKVKL